ncbi:hypothetical protein Glove_362g39 [Diversispora epigaea]|uniref:Protein kinase domain-containing protein n=1 Tax=Diversispora epigaea TaxID=1348612 RepID=A0A397H9A9_9GLOM|nr:hypothetical protein Glove_362g39 [Diversispora epigaea]
MFRREYCPAGHSSDDLGYYNDKNYISPSGLCCLCTKEHSIQEFSNWSSGDVNVDKIIQESQITDLSYMIEWIPYDNFQNIKHIADGGYGSVYSAMLRKGIKSYWDFNQQDWKCNLVNDNIALKEIKDSRYNISEILKMYIMIVREHGPNSIIKYYGISKNPSTQNYILVEALFDNNLYNFLTKNYWYLRWKTKLNLLVSMLEGLESFHDKDLVNCDLHSGNVLINHVFNSYDLKNIILAIDFDSCKLENDLILNFDHKNNEIYGSIPYIPPGVLRGNKFTREGDIYSFGGIMYEIVTAQQPFADQAHDTYLMIDICNDVRPRVPDFMLNWIPKWYLILMNQCWSGDPSKRPTVTELYDIFDVIPDKLIDNIVDDKIMRRLKRAIENEKKAFKYQKQELYELFSYSRKSHPQSCYISRRIHTLHGLHDLLDDTKSGKSPVQ